MVPALVALTFILAIGIVLTLSRRLRRPPPRLAKMANEHASVADRLVQLNNRWAAGLMTDEEYSTARAALFEESTSANPKDGAQH